jgi:hypothetical protein
MPEDTKPTLTPDAAAALAVAASGAQTTPLRVPPGCTVAVELLDPGDSGSATRASTPSQQPPAG